MLAWIILFGMKAGGADAPAPVAAAQRGFNPMLAYAGKLMTRMWPLLLLVL